jgi:flavin reductase (DIM6/NTAB) family NADH-FMN oxidoreductase RutF
MSKQKMQYTDHYDKVARILAGRGLLLGAYDAGRKPNLMTIGWGALGNIWGVPMWMVLVRPSRYTYRCIEHSGCFSVNVPPDSLAMACATCGSKSGRDTNKFAACGLTEVKGSSALAPTVAECPIVYECQVVHSHDVLPAKLADEILAGMYLSGDYHRVYYGKVLASLADAGAAGMLEG